MKKNVAVVFILVLVLTGCTKNIYLMPEYDNMKIKNKTLFIVQPEIAIENPKDVTDDLGEGNPKKVYKDFFNTNFKLQMKELSTFNKVEFSQANNHEKLYERKLSLSENNNIYINLPHNGEIVEFDSIHADFVLLFEDYQTYRKGAHDSNQTAITGITWKTNVGAQPALKTSFKYVIWDNNNGRIVAYGNIDSSSKFAFKMSTKTWYNSIRNILVDILIDTPFENFPEGMR